MIYVVVQSILISIISEIFYQEKVIDIDLNK